MYGFVLNEFKQPNEAEKYTSKVIATMTLSLATLNPNRPRAVNLLTAGVS